MSTHAERLPRYKQLRQAGIELNTKLGKTTSRSEMGEGGRKLGLLDGNTLVLETDDEIAVLMDFILHDVRRHGLNPIERYLQTSPPPEGSDEWVLLQSLRRSRFSIFAVKSVEKGVGVTVEDLLRGGEHFLVDVGFGSSAAAGMVFVMRVMEADGIGMTTGAALPLGKLPAAERRRLVKDIRDDFKGVDFANMAPEEAGDLAADVLRFALEQGASQGISYVAPEEVPPPKAKPARRRKKGGK